MTDAEDVAFTLDGRELIAHPPTTGQLALFVAASGSGGLKTITGIFEFMEAVLDEDDYDYIEELLHEGVDLDLITDIISALIGEWSARPTGSSSGSTSSRKRTGKPSTAKPR